MGKIEKLVAPFLFLALGSPQARAFSYEDLVTLIQTGRLRAVEDVLPKLPETLRSSYVLMYASRSLQGASDTSPRAVIFGDDARLTCAFNGDPSQKGFDTLECFQFRTDERRFDFRQIRFPTAQNGLSEVKFSKSGLSTDGTVSCSSCHSADPRPNWDSYLNWPGAYGSYDDDLKLSGETARYATFVARRNGHPRYRWLIQSNEPNAPYLGDFQTSSRPNLRFSEATSVWNDFRDERILRSKAQDWEDLAFAIDSIGCRLTSDEKQRLAQAGLSQDLDALALAAFQKTGLRGSDWTTQIASDPEPNAGPAYEHYPDNLPASGRIAMVSLIDRAAGNSDLKSAVDAVAAYDRSSQGQIHGHQFELSLSIVLPDPMIAFNDEPNTLGAGICKVAKGLLWQETPGVSPAPSQ